MLMALLYCEPDRIGAAAFACDQMALGDAYWQDAFAGEIEKGSVFETAYVTVNNHELCYKLLNIGIDDAFDGTELAAALEKIAVPPYVTERAA
jgi:hypothetical protein